MCFNNIILDARINVPIQNQNANIYTYRKNQTQGIEANYDIITLWHDYAITCERSP